MKRVFVAQHPAEAQMVAGFLASHGIEAIVRGDALFGARGEAPVTSDTLPTVWVVDDEAVERAMAMLSDRPGLVGECWTCSQCGQTVEPQFSACWQCGAERGRH